MNENMNDQGKRLKNGSYSMLVCALVIVAAILVNLIVSRMPSQMTQRDFSSAKLYTLTETTESFLQTLNQDVSLYYICESGQEDDYIVKILERYNDASNHITTSQVDPAVYPGFTSQYTEDTVANNSVIAVSDTRSKVVSAEDMYLTDYSYATNSVVKVGFDAEGMITSAIDYVTSDDIPVFYVLNANGEQPLGESYTEVIQKNNIDLAQLNLMSADSVPQDAAGIIINAPTKDYSPEEAEKILRYLEAGGKAIIFSNYSGVPLVNFETILANYGICKDPGIILEGDSDKYIAYQYSVLPDVYYSEITAGVYGNTYVITPMAQAIMEMETYRSSISHVPLLMTSASSYAKEDVQNMSTSEKEPGDVDGPFTVGMLIQEDINTDKTVDTEIIYYSTGYILDEDYNQSVSGANAQLIGDSLSYLCNAGELSAAVPTKNLQVSSLTITDFSANIWTVLTVFVIPAVFVAAGLTVWVKRRKR